MLLGIDGGGTTCRARLVDDDGRCLGQGLSGSANIGLGIAVAASAVLDATTEALRAAGLGPERLPSICAGLGLAGANVPELADAVAAHPFPFAATAIASDAVTACLGAHAGRDGGILILGTGSQGLALVEGKVLSLGGWGFALSDGGSGAALGRSLVRAAVAAFDGLAPVTALTERVLERLGGSPASALHWSRAATPRHYGTFAPDLFAGAAAGDPVALAIVGAAAAEVDAMADSLARSAAARLVLMGGLAGPYRGFLAPRTLARLVEPKGDALDGAIRLARQGAPG